MIITASLMMKTMKMRNRKEYKADAAERGAMAVDLLCEGKSNRVIGHKGGKFVDFDIDEALAMKKDVDEYMYEISKTLV